MNVSRQHKRSRGVTLVELLVVVTILMMLAAFTIPAMRGLTEGRKVREAARAIDVFLAQQKTRAVELQRPVGVELQRFTLNDVATGNASFQDDACTVLRAVEIPAPYGGDFTNSRVRIQNWSGSYGTPYYVDAQGVKYFCLKILIMANDFASDTLLRRGDQIQFNYQGPKFTIVQDPKPSGGDFPAPNEFITFSAGKDNNGDLYVDTHVLTVVTPWADLGGVPWPEVTGWPSPALNTLDLKDWSLPVPFQVFRQPQPSPIPPLRLPRDTVIDLADSGYYDSPSDGAFAANGLYPDAFGLVTNHTSTAAADHRGPMILFAPNGSISAVYHWVANSSGGGASYLGGPITKPVFLMVGKFERTGNEAVSAGSPVRSLAEDGLHNWQDATNLWIAVNPVSGLVTAAEVNAPFVTATGLSLPGDPAVTVQADLATQMQISRQLAREAQISKGAL